MVVCLLLLQMGDTQGDTRNCDQKEGRTGGKRVESRRTLFALLCSTALCLCLLADWLEWALDLFGKTAVRQ